MGRADKSVIDFCFKKKEKKEKMNFVYIFRGSFSPFFLIYLRTSIRLNWINPQLSPILSQG